MAANEFDFSPPPGPPPMLTIEQLQHLAFNGWLAVSLPPALQEGLHELSRCSETFFDISHGEKRKLYPSRNGTECGFYHVQNEKEYVTFRHQVHPDSKLEEHVRRVWRDIARFLHRILCDLSRAAELSEHVWDHLIEGSFELPEDDGDMDDVITLMRTFRYYPTEGIALEHVDIGLVTLCVGDGRGLQMFDHLSEQRKLWVNAEGPVVLLGATARALLNNRIRAGLHRVVGNPEGRSSIVYALRPNLKHPTDLGTFGGEGEVDTKEFFYRVKGSKYNVNATKEVRERQRQAQRELAQKTSTGVNPGQG